jgi:hypothetical protein
LKSSRSVDAGKGVAGKGEVLLPGAGSDKKDLRSDENIGFSVLENSDFLVAEYGERGASRPDTDMRKGS